MEAVIFYKVLVWSFAEIGCVFSIVKIEGVHEAGEEMG